VPLVLLERNAGTGAVHPVRHPSQSDDMLDGLQADAHLVTVLKKQNESAALGLVAARIVESATIFVGVAFLLSIVTLRKAGAGPGALPSSHALVAMYDRIFLLGQSFIPAICDLLLGLLLYHSRLVPRALCRIGIVGAPILVAGYLAVLFGAIHQHGSLAGLSHSRSRRSSSRSASGWSSGASTRKPSPNWKADSWAGEG
jgi:hypothetical protein